MNRRYRFRYIGVKNVVKELDGWIRRHLRKLVWRQWKRNYTRARNLMTPGDWKKGMEQCAERSRCLVERRSISYESGVT